MDDDSKEITIEPFCFADLKKKFDDAKQIANNPNHNGSKELSIRKLLQSCVEIMNTGKNDLECIRKRSYTSSTIVANLISYEKGVFVSFSHCSESNIIYGDIINTVVIPLLTELFKVTTEVQTLFFHIFENVKFDFMQIEDRELLLNGLQQIWYSAKVAHNTSNKVMANTWKMYVTVSQKYSAELKRNIINDEPIDFLCSEIKKIIFSLKDNNESSLKLITFMMSVLVKLCSYGCMLKSHNILLEFILFLNSYWLLDTQDVVAVKNRLSPYANQLVLISDETFIEVFQLNCQEIINSDCSKQKISVLYIAILLLKRFTKTPCDQQAYEIICIVFQFIGFTDSVMCCYNMDIYEHLLVNVVSVILVSDYSLFEKVEEMLIKSILNTEYWPAMFSSDLWIIVMRYVPSEMCILQFSKLAQILEALSDFPCFTQCPQHIFLETLLRRHFALITDKKKLVNTCPQFKTQSLKSAVGILHVPTLSKYDRLSELVKILTILPEQKNNEHLNLDIEHLWSCVRNEHPSSFICALIEISIGSKSLLKRTIPESTKILNVRANDDTIDLKRSRLRLIRSILLHMPPFKEKLIVDIFLEYLFDPHPMVQQWAVETIVYFCSVAGNQNNLISMLFKQSKVRSIITDYLEMKIGHIYNYNECTQYFKQLSKYGKFQHKCSFKDKLDKVLNRLKMDIDCLNNSLTETQISVGELEKLKEYSSHLNNIYKAKELEFDECLKRPFI